MAQVALQERAPGGHERSDAGAKVVVACKLPAGLMIRGYAKSQEREAVMGGGTRDFEVFRWTGEEAQIFGTATPFGMAPKCLIVGGYALTPNISKDLFDSWMAANKDGELVKKNLIFAFERAESTQAAAKEYTATLSGFEPIDPDNPGRKIRGIEKSDVK